jgi:hypothetical protein
MPGRGLPPEVAPQPIIVAVDPTAGSSLQFAVKDGEHLSVVGVLVLGVESNKRQMSLGKPFAIGFQFG